jgi:diguanylate cyclase (GGDEF)-like protein
VSTGSTTRVRDPWKWYLPHRAIILLGIVLTLIALAGAFLGVANASEAESLNSKVTQRYLVLLEPVREVRAHAADFQVLASQAFADTALAGSLVPRAEKDTNAMNKAYSTLQHLLVSSDATDLAPRLPARMTAFVNAQDSLGAFLAGQAETPQTAQLATAEKAADANLDNSLGALQVTITNRASATADQAHAAANRARTELLWSIVIGVALAGIVIAVLTRHALRVEREQAKQDAQQSELTRRIEFEASLQSALEMSKAEASVFGLVAEALSQAAPDMRSELLLADSSTAHFSQVLVSSTQEDDAGCGVMSPDDCPAASRARTMVFPRSMALDACPHLRGRGCSALCVPMSISGSSMGVFHVTTDDGAPPSDAVQANVEVVARRASERLAMLRAFEMSQTQANSDSLTGLMTRRSLETAVRELGSTGTPYAVAYGDLDHFKNLNDAFGHATGDRALRTFSSVLRDSLRPVDIACRYGGEEFVIVLPDCPMEEAYQVLERVRERLADRIIIAAAPSFTVSFGLAASDQGGDFDHVVSLADAALLNAKAGGRDQIVVSEGPVPPGAHPASVSVRLEPRPRTNAGNGGGVSGGGSGNGGDPALREHQHN